MNKKEFLNSKICKNFNDVKFSRWLAYWRFKTEKIVFVYGDFDILHYGNMRLITQAAEFGSVLIVGVRNSKNKQYLHESYQRAFNLAALHYVDYVIVFDEEDFSALVDKISPDVVVLSYRQTEDIDFFENKKIKVEKFKCPEGFSSDEFYNKLKLYQK